MKKKSLVKDIHILQKRTTFFLIIISILAVVIYFLISVTNLEKQQKFALQIVSKYINDEILAIDKYLDVHMYLVTTKKDFEKIIFFLQKDIMFEDVQFYETTKYIDRKWEVKKSKNLWVLIFKIPIRLENGQQFVIKCTYNIYKLNYIFIYLDFIFNYNYVLVNKNDSLIILSDNYLITGLKAFPLYTKPNPINFYNNVKAQLVLGCTKKLDNFPFYLTVESDFWSFYSMPLKNIFIIVAIIIGISVFIYYIVKRQLGEKLKPLSMVAEKMANVGSNKGFLGEYIKDIDSEDEIGILVSTYNNMIKHLSFYLQNQRLHTQLAMAESFIIGISHEISNPLNVLNESLKKMKTESKEILIIKDEVDKINKVIKDMLHIQKKLEKQLPDKVDLQKVINDVVNDFKHDVNITIRDKNSNNEKIYIIGNENIYNLILTEVIRNSIKSMKENNSNDLEIIIQRAKKYDVEVLIIDTGTGIRRTEANSIFKPFYSGKSSSGLGLYFCKESVRHYQGEIRFVFLENENISNVLSLTFQIWE